MVRREKFLSSLITGQFGSDRMGLPQERRPSSAVSPTGYLDYQRLLSTC
ncbi:MAG: hypothetical protein Q9N34_07915 [Aquificota bacterium]|nr:hypothetical protein [Aquificota bacterium]